MSKEVEVPQEAIQLPVVDPQPQAEPQINLEGIEVYQDAIMKFKAKVAEQVKLGVMSEQVAVKIILENEYGFFQQIVKVSYK